MSSYSKYSGGRSGVSVLSVVQIVFIILKCSGLIDWPWRYVLLPILVNIGFIAVRGIIIFIVFLIDAYRRKRERGRR